MYTRSYFTEDKKIDIPENYDGTAFNENRNEFAKENDAQVPDLEKEVSEEAFAEAEATAGRGIFTALADKIPLKSLGRILPFPPFRDSPQEKEGFTFGTEEILIAIIALYMFFSKDGDRECAIMLAILLFIH